MTRNYYGIDFNFFAGETVVATLGGTVVDTENPPIDDRGNVVEIQHPGGYKSRYLHLRDELDGQGPPFPATIYEGATILQGDVVGFSGDTPNVDPHLHFDMQFFDAQGSHAHKAEPISGWAYRDNLFGFGRWGYALPSEGGLGCTVFSPSPDITSGPPADGDGYSDAVEPSLNTDVLGRCGPGGAGASAYWPADLDTAIRRINIGEINSFFAPARSASDGHIGALWSKFSHPLDDDGDTVIESNEDPVAEPGTQAYNIRRWNIDLPPHTAATFITNCRYQ